MRGGAGERVIKRCWGSKRLINGVFESADVNDTRCGKTILTGARNSGIFGAPGFGKETDSDDRRE